MIKIENFGQSSNESCYPSKHAELGLAPNEDARLLLPTELTVLSIKTVAFDIGIAKSVGLEVAEPARLFAFAVVRHVRDAEDGFKYSIVAKAATPAASEHKVLDALDAELGRPGLVIGERLTTVVLPRLLAKCDPARHQNIIALAGVRAHEVKDLKLRGTFGQRLSLSKAAAKAGFMLGSEDAVSDLNYWANGLRRYLALIVVHRAAASWRLWLLDYCKQHAIPLLYERECDALETWLAANRINVEQ